MTVREKIENGVMVADDGELFLVGGNHDVLSALLGKKKISEDSKTNFQANIERRSAYCQKRGIKYGHVVFPDKHVVYAEKLSVNPVGLYEQYRGYTGEGVRYPVEFLRDLDRPVFLKFDTHLNDYAHHEMARWMLMEVLGASAIPQISLEEKSVEYSGDLGSKLKEPLIGIKQIYKRNWGVERYTNNITGNDGIIDIYINRNNDAGARILVFGDSFFRTIAEFMSLYVGQVMFCRSRYFHDEMVDQISPDAVLTGNVERYLSNIQKDACRPIFLLYPALNGRDAKPSLGFYQALNAFLSYGRKPYYEFLSGFAGDG